MRLSKIGLASAWRKCNYSQSSSKYKIEHQYLQKGPPSLTQMLLLSCLSKPHICTPMRKLDQLQSAHAGRSGSAVLAVMHGGIWDASDALVSGAQDTSDAKPWLVVRCPCRIVLVVGRSRPHDAQPLSHSTTETSKSAWPDTVCTPDVDDQEDGAQRTHADQLGKLWFCVGDEVGSGHGLILKQKEEHGRGKERIIS